ncbi:hypothetical protein Tco_0693252 [Tanacetum coccineum]
MPGYLYARLLSPRKGNAMPKQYEWPSKMHAGSLSKNPPIDAYGWCRRAEARREAPKQHLSLLSYRADACRWGVMKCPGSSISPP